MTTDAASLTPLYTSKDGSFHYTIQPFDRDNEDQVTFLRRRLSREAASAMSSFLRVAMDAEQSVVLMAFRVHASSSSHSASSVGITGKPIGMVLFDVSVVPQSGVAALLWISVLFDASGVGVGSRLLTEGEVDVQSLGATCIETSTQSPSDFYHHVGYTRCTNPVYYAPFCAAKKVLKEADTNAAAASEHVAEAHITAPPEEDSETAPAPSRVKAAAPRERADKRPRAGVTKASLPRKARRLHDKAVPERQDKQPKKVGRPRNATSTASPVPAAAGRAAASSTASSARVASPSSSSSEDSDDDSGEASSSDSHHHSGSSHNTNDGDGGVMYDIPNVPDDIASRNVFLRLATAQDKKEWWSLILATTHYNVGGTELLPSTLEAALRVVAVRRSDNAIIGLVAMQADGWVTFLCTDESYQGKGMGSFLLFVALEWARRHGLRSAGLSPLRFSLIKFYQRWGFTEDGAEHPRKRKKVCPGDTVTMTRIFDPTFALLPNGATLQTYIRDYDASTEVSSPGGPTYYWYYPKRKATKPLPPQHTTSTGNDATSSKQSGAPFSEKIRTLWSWSNLLVK